MSMQDTAGMPVANYTLAITASNGTTAKQNVGRASKLRLVGTADMFIQIKRGSSPTAAVTDTFLPANSPEYFALITSGSGDVYVTGIVASGTGTLYVTEIVS